MSNNAIKTNQITNLLNFGLKPESLGKQKFDVFGDGVDHLKGVQFYVPPSLMGSPDYCPIEYHYFEREFFAYMWNFAMNCNNTIAFLYGPSGTGKTSGVEQFFARLNWPSVTFNASKRKELIDLEGSWLPQEQGMEFFDGCLIDCIQNGKVLIINEISLMDPGEIAGLNDIKPGSVFTLSSKGGEKIQVHPNYRLVVTDNTNGLGDSSGQFGGTGRLNGAFLDRCRGYEKNYLPEEEEQTVLEKALDQLLEKLLVKGTNAEEQMRDSVIGLIPALVNFAYETRVEAQNRNLGFPLTTRKLIDILNLVMCYRSSDAPLYKAIEQSYLWRLRDHDKAMVENMFKMRFKKAA